MSVAAIIRPSSPFRRSGGSNMVPQAAEGMGARWILSYMIRRRVLAPASCLPSSVLRHPSCFYVRSTLFPISSVHCPGRRSFGGRMANGGYPAFPRTPTQKSPGHALPGHEAPIRGSAGTCVSVRPSRESAHIRSMCSSDSVNGLAFELRLGALAQLERSRLEGMPISPISSA